MYFHRELCAHEGRQVLQGRLGDLRDGAVVEKEALLGLLPHALDFTQGALNGGLGAEVAVERDAETVRLIADALEHLQGLGVAVDEQGIRVAHADDLLQALRQAHDREPDRRCPAGPCRRR